MCLRPQQQPAAAAAAAEQPADITSIAVLPPPPPPQQQAEEVTNMLGSSIANATAAAAAVAPAPPPLNTTGMLPQPQQQQQSEAGASIVLTGRANMPSLVLQPSADLPQGRPTDHLSNAQARTGLEAEEQEEGMPCQLTQHASTPASPRATTTTRTLHGSPFFKLWLILAAVVAVTAVIFGHHTTVVICKQETPPTTPKSNASTLWLQVTLQQLSPKTLKQQKLALPQLEAASAALAKQADDISILMQKIMHERESSKMKKERKHLAGLYQELSRGAADQRTLCSLTGSALSMLFDNIAKGLTSVQEDWQSKSKLHGLASIVDLLIAHINQVAALVERAQSRHSVLQECITQLQREVHHVKKLTAKHANAKSKEKKKPKRKAETDELNAVELMVQEDLLQEALQNTADDFSILHAIGTELIALRRDMENSKHAIHSLQHELETKADLSSEQWTSILGAFQHAADKFQMQTWKQAAPRSHEA